jgi:hypothetical protein
MISNAELSLQVAGTRAFILADPEDIQLLRPTRTEDGEGGWVNGDFAPLATQTCRMIPQSDQVEEISTPDGRMARPEYVILFEPGSDMKRYDEFIWRDTRWQIVQIHSKPDYEMKGDVIRYV